MWRRFEDYSGRNAARGLDLEVVWGVRVFELAMQIPGWDELQVGSRIVHKVAAVWEVP